MGTGFFLLASGGKCLKQRVKVTTTSVSGRMMMIDYFTVQRSCSAHLSPSDSSLFYYPHRYPSN